MVTIRVGGDAPEDFFVHKALLCETSDFFLEALTGGFEESRTNIIRLPDDGAKTFSLYSCWLYNSSPFATTAVADLAATALTGDALQKAKDDLADESEWLAEAYQFGIKILDHDFCDMVLDRMLGRALDMTYWPFKSFFEMFCHSNTNDPQRRLLVDIWLYVSQGHWFERGGPAFNAEAWKEITKALVANKGASLTSADGPWRSDPCHYHWHRKNGTLCYKVKRT